MRTYNPTLRLICNDEEKHLHIIKNLKSKGYTFLETKKESITNQGLSTILVFSKLGLLSEELDKFQAKISEDLNELKSAFSDYEIQVTL